MPLGIPRGARCVQRFDDSLNSAIHITYRISLRSSSMREPRDPLLKVLFLFTIIHVLWTMYVWRVPKPREAEGTVHGVCVWMKTAGRPISNDPSAGSPTETLLRLLLPLNDQV